MMLNWKQKILRKKNKGSQTPGKLKGPTCSADWRKKYYFCNPKATKDRQYKHYHRMAMEMNGMKV